MQVVFRLMQGDLLSLQDTREIRRTERKNTKETGNDRVLFLSDKKRDIATC